MAEAPNEFMILQLVKHLGRNYKSKLKIYYIWKLLKLKKSPFQLDTEEGWEGIYNIITKFATWF